MRYIAALLASAWLSSCTAIAVGGVTIGSMIFVRENFTLFQSTLVRNVQSKINAELSFNKGEVTNEVKLLQEGDKIYAIGTVSSPAIKEKIEGILRTYFHGAYTGEIAVSTVKRNITKDLYLKIRIKSVMLMTKYVRSGNYTVLVYNERGYVIGRTQNSEEAELLTQSLSEIEDIEDIVAYIL